MTSGGSKQSQNRLNNSALKQYRDDTSGISPQFRPVPSPDARKNSSPHVAENPVGDDSINLMIKTNSGNLEDGMCIL